MELPPNNSNNITIHNSRPNTTSTTGDVYIIPDYTTTRSSHPAQILVLPFVPHPSNTLTNVHPAPAQIQPAPPPHYFYTGQYTLSG